jgi:hypothetical protein
LKNHLKSFFLTVSIIFLVASCSADRFLVCEKGDGKCSYRGLFPGVIEIRHGTKAAEFYALTDDGLEKIRVSGEAGIPVAYDRTRGYLALSQMVDDSYTLSILDVKKGRQRGETSLPPESLPPKGVFCGDFLYIVSLYGDDFEIVLSKISLSDAADQLNFKIAPSDDEKSFLNRPLDLACSGNRLFLVEMNYHVSAAELYEIDLEKGTLRYMNSIFEDTAKFDINVVKARMNRGNPYFYDASNNSFYAWSEGGATIGLDRYDGMGQPSTLKIAESGELFFSPYGSKGALLYLIPARNDKIATKAKIMTL